MNRRQLGFDAVGVQVIAGNLHGLPLVFIRLTLTDGRAATATLTLWPALKVAGALLWNVIRARWLTLVRRP